MSPRSLRWALFAVLAAGAPSVAAQAAPDAAHERVAGCYAIAPAPEAPWLREVESRVRLTLEPAAAEPGTGRQFLARAAPGERTGTRYSYFAWSLFGEGRIVSIVWSSDSDMVALTFEPDPDRARAVSFGSTEVFAHALMKTSPPVDVRVTAIDC